MLNITIIYLWDMLSAINASRMWYGYVHLFLVLLLLYMWMRYIMYNKCIIDDIWVCASVFNIIIVFFLCMWLLFYSEIYIFAPSQVCHINIVIPYVYFGTKLIISKQILFGLEKQ